MLANAEQRMEISLRTAEYGVSLRRRFVELRQPTKDLSELPQQPADDLQEQTFPVVRADDAVLPGLRRSGYVPPYRQTR